MCINENEVVFVAAMDKGTGHISTGTSCDRKDANRYANIIGILDTIQGYLHMKNWKN